jgi:RND family efflux transporter MFP subunit
MKNTFKKSLLTTLILATIILVSCTRGVKEESVSMEEIHRQQGIPVRIQVVEPQEFIREIDYNITVSGLRETPVYSRLTDQIQSINARVGQVVQQDQIIISFPQNNPQASFYQAKAAYDMAEQTWQRMQGLFQTGGISQQELDGAETQFKVAQANWDAVQQSVHVRAPISGTITDINVREMQRVGAGDYLFTISQLNRLHGRVWISESDINLVPRNARVIFNWNDIEKEARITNLALSVNRDRNAFAADVEIENADFAIRSGVTGRAIIVIYQNPEAIVVPRNVVQRDQNNQHYVYVAEYSRAKRRNVKIGNESELNLEIVEGLYPGDYLITAGLQLITDEARINVRD